MFSADRAQKTRLAAKAGHVGFLAWNLHIPEIMCESQERKGKRDRRKTMAAKKSEKLGKSKKLKKLASTTVIHKWGDGQPD